MINTDYSHDLPINTMGRRIRTRLYFTSESHLHTVLNVLRFANNDGKPILSKAGMEIINSTPELCYLTHIVMRVFDDSRPEMQDDPKRFRVEILFSPGATATPVQLRETDRDTDSARFDTAPQQVIGRECLSCEELESFFGKAIIAGRSEDEEYPEADSMSTMPERFHRVVQKEKNKHAHEARNSLATFEEVDSTDVKPGLPPSSVTPPAGIVEESGGVSRSGQRALSKTAHEEPVDSLGAGLEPRDELRDSDTTTGLSNVDEKGDSVASDGNDNRRGDDDELADDHSGASSNATLLKAIARKRFWSTVAIGSFLVGTTCLLFAMRLADDARTRTGRWSTRRNSR
jgi:Histidine phosphatase superfamily (branch 2)